MLALESLLLTVCASLCVILVRYSLRAASGDGPARFKLRVVVAFVEWRPPKSHMKPHNHLAKQCLPAASSVIDTFGPPTKKKLVHAHAAQLLRLLPPKHGTPRVCQMPASSSKTQGHNAVTVGDSTHLHVHDQAQTKLSCINGTISLPAPTTNRCGDLKTTRPDRRNRHA